jgi:DNA adenine methylase
MAVEPFLRWAGGKRRLLQAIRKHIPQDLSESHYFEPFLGGAAVFFAIEPPNATLSDLNAELIEVYECIRDDVESVVSKLLQFKHSSKEFYRIRAQRPWSPSGKAARFIYLNKTCFNGLYRVNTQGVFNVPFGRHPNVEICNAEQLRFASQALSTTTILEADFEAVAREAASGDVVYFDPPYTVSHTNNGFVEYNQQIFSWVDQERLARLAGELVDDGVRCVISNADHSSIRKLYSDSSRFRIRRASRWSTVAGSADKRFATSELVIVGPPEE